MHKIVLDTNIFVSAILKNQSNPGHIIDLIKEKKLTLFLSPDIILEIATVLSYPKLKKIHGLTPKGIKSHLKGLKSIAEIVVPTTRLDIIERDSSDNIYLECAIETDADFIISGDHHLTDLETYEGVRIVSPATFLKIIQDEK
jgi:putative PIN family toxin of toxin-antitoxin system